MIVFKTSSVKAADKYPATLLEFQIEGDGNIDPGDIPTAIANLPKIDGTKGVIISGRGPVWLFGALLHHLHVTRWSATFDPRQGAVVVASHHVDSPQAGAVLSVPKSA